MFAQYVWQVHWSLDRKPVLLNSGDLNLRVGLRAHSPSTKVAGVFVASAFYPPSLFGAFTSLYLAPGETCYAPPTIICIILAQLNGMLA
jgi:hypothetical protein